MRHVAASQDGLRCYIPGSVGHAAKSTNAANGPRLRERYMEGSQRDVIFPIVELKGGASKSADFKWLTESTMAQVLDESDGSVLSAGAVYHTYLPQT